MSRDKGPVKRELRRRPHRPSHTASGRATSSKS